MCYFERSDILTSLIANPILIESDGDSDSDGESKCNSSDEALALEPAAVKPPSQPQLGDEPSDDELRDIRDLLLPCLRLEAGIMQIPKT